MREIRAGATVVVGMSGGVDSSLTAALLKEQGFNVIGLFMKNWEEKELDGACTQEADFADVTRVATQLKIPYYTVNFTKEYRDQVFEEFLTELKKGRTPNPDILCNREIKFKHLMNEAIKMGAEYLATGHYAQIDYRDNAHRLLKGNDPTKDQSYFLYTLNQTHLPKVLFPVGSMPKTEVRELAKKYNLATAEKKDSTGICFIGERNFRPFLNQFLPYQTGNLELLSGKVVGQHCGIAYYTIGQRRGLGLGGEGEAWFVVGKDAARNVVYVERGLDHPALFSDYLIAKKPSWVADAPPSHCRAKIRYRQSDQECRVTLLEDDMVRVDFAEPQRAITEEQSVVFYDGDVCCGGAIIDKRGPSHYEQRK